MCEYVSVCMCVCSLHVCPPQKKGEEKGKEKKGLSYSVFGCRSQKPTKISLSEKGELFVRNMVSQGNPW